MNKPTPQSRPSVADKYILPDGRTPVPDIVEVTVPEPDRRRWTQEAKMAFQELQPAAVYIIATEHAISGAIHSADGAILRAWGGDDGVRLYRIGVTSAQPWGDKLTAAHARGPVAVKLLTRLWVPSDGHVVRFEQTVDLGLAARASEADVNGYHALPAATRDAELIASLKALGRSEGMQWVEDDRELFETCLRMAERARAVKSRRWHN